MKRHRNLKYHKTLSHIGWSDLNPKTCSWEDCALHTELNATDPNEIDEYAFITRLLNLYGIRLTSANSEGTCKWHHNTHALQITH
jgi:hypothetical protein